MKLYTEEQVRQMLSKARGDIWYSDNELFATQTPIELPSDEELKKQFDIDEFDPYDLAYLGGAIRMRNLIQGGNNEQQ